MLERVQHIEGLDSTYESADLFDDTPPGEVQIKFTVESEEMPFLSAQEGRIIRKNFVYVTAVWELGRSMWKRRIRDKIAFDENTKKWRVLQLATVSDIKRWPSQWNSFALGATEDITGTPLTLLFKNDPSRAEMYKSKHISTIEHLASLGDTSASEIGMGGREDVQRAKVFLQKTKENAPTLQTIAKLEEKDRQIDTLQSQISELTARFAQLLERQEEDEPIKRRGKAKSGETEITERI